MYVIERGVKNWLNGEVAFPEPEGWCYNRATFSDDKSEIETLEWYFQLLIRDYEEEAKELSNNTFTIRIRENDEGPWKVYNLKYETIIRMDITPV